MPTIEHVTLSELQHLLQSLHLPPDTRLTVKFEDAQTIQRAVKTQKAVAAMKKLKSKTVTVSNCQIIRWHLR